MPRKAAGAWLQGCSASGSDDASGPDDASDASSAPRTAAPSRRTRRRMSTIQKPRPMRASTPQVASAQRQPRAAARGPVPIRVAIDPMFIIAEYSPVTIDTCSQGTSRRMITGTTILPSVIARPMMPVPTSTSQGGPADRSTVPASTPDRQASTVASAPRRVMKRPATGVASAKRNTGSPVSRPSPAELKPVPSWIRGRIAVGAMIGARRLSARTTMPRTIQGSILRVWEEMLTSVRGRGCRAPRGRSRGPRARSPTGAGGSSAAACRR